MLVFAREKLVFLAMPKTGTTSLVAALEPMASVVLRHQPNLKHTGAGRYSKYLRPFLERGGVKNLTSVCVLRHPVDWLGSWYRYRQRPAKDGAFNSTKGMSFETYVAEYVSDDPAKWVQVGNPARFIRDDKGNMAVDHLFQYEQMDIFVEFLEDRLGKTINLPRRNVSPEGDLTLSAELRRTLEAKFPQMFEDWENARL